MLEEGQEVPRGMSAEPGIVEQVVYVGMSTRYMVRLDRGEQLVAVRQNIDAPGQALRYEGRRVRLAWVPSHTYDLDHQRARGEPATGGY
jgi:putative spermidine/putrescine transport system ATP-binding protein